MRYLSEICVCLIEDKQPISDDLLVVCYDYCKDYDFEQGKRIKKVLEKTIIECLKDDIDLRTKEWFQRYIMESNVLLLDKTIRGERSKDKRISSLNAADLSQFQNNSTTSTPRALFRTKTITDDNRLFQRKSTAIHPVVLMEEKEKEKEKEEEELKLKDSLSVMNNNNAVIDHFVNTTKPFVENKLIYGFFAEKMNYTKEKAAKFIQNKCQSIEDDDKISDYWKELLSYQCKECSGMIDDLIDVRQDRIDQITGITRRIPTIASITSDMNDAETNRFDVTARTVEFFQV